MQYKPYSRIPFFVLFLILFSGCEIKRDALGADNEIRVICSEIDKPIIRKYLSAIFTDTVYTPQPEPYYHLKFSDPDAYNSLKAQSQVVVAAVNRDPGNPGYQLMKRLLTKSQFEETENNDPILIARDLNAKNQLFMIVNGQSEEHVMRTAQSKRNRIRKHFFDLFKERQKRFLFSETRNKKLEESILETHGWRIKIPWGWEMIRNSPDSNFVWIGREMPFQWVSINWHEGNLVDDELSVGNFIWSWPSTYYGIVQFNHYKFKLNNVKFRNHNAWLAEGIWETIDLKESKGGPFSSYLFYDKKNDRTYHLNFLVHSPNNDKSIYMRQMKMIVKTFSAHQ